jgi:hypothetical protein
MKPLLRVSSFILLVAVAIHISCKKETSCEGCATKSNKQPIAVAGPDQAITLPIDSVSLDGRSSSDPDGSISNYLWTKISGPVSFNMIKPTDSLTKVKALVVGTYLFELKVTDNGGLSAKDTAQVIVIDPSIPNRSPVANAGADQVIILPTNTITLNGNGSTDPDNNITSYLWTKISGPSSFNIANANAVQTQVTTLVQGVYQFELKVMDSGNLMSKDTLLINVREILNGLEIIYNGGWSCNDICADGDVYWDSSPWHDNLYFDSSIALQVSIRLDTSSVWIDVHKINSSLPPINQFYWQIDRRTLWVFAYEGRLIGTPVTIKVKLL